ncbi:uncharacterized protein LOC114311309 isoform X2 [Camellia sinensis]|uniref:uncharacterized protein LOC114311309 isoform X2 n=1 Tax=Camellia sinensis TaxID=4442 RepID=UPI001036D7E5|nr:uncharacterized protein LOC114311309 isoform X2 [Camellia sinensis]
MHLISIANWLHVYIHDQKSKRDLKASAHAFQAEAKVFPDPIAKGSDNDTSINHHCSHLFGHLLPTQKGQNQIFFLGYTIWGIGARLVDAKRL